MNMYLKYIFLLLEIISTIRELSKDLFCLFCFYLKSLDNLVLKFCWPYAEKHGRKKKEKHGRIS